MAAALKISSEKQAVSDKLAFGAIFFLIQFAPMALVLIWCYPQLVETQLSLITTASAILGVAAFAIYNTLNFLGLDTSPLTLAFTFVTFTAYLDTFLAPSVAFKDFALGKFYIEQGEEYFRSAYGFSAMLWDGTFQFAMQFVLTFLLLTRRSHNRAEFHYIGLVWAGSIINSMGPLLIGAAIGPYSAELKLATWFNAPYVLFPVSVVVWLMQRRHAVSECKVSNRSPLDFLIICFHLVMPAIHIVRVMTVLKSRTPIVHWWTTYVEPVWGNIGDVDDLQDYSFLSAQVMQFAWWFIPFHMYFTYELVQRTHTNMRRAGGVEVDLSALVLGAYLQSTACLVGVSVLDVGSNGGLVLRNGGTGWLSSEFWFVNVSTVVMSIVSFLSLCVSDDEEELVNEDVPRVKTPVALPPIKQE